MLAALLALGLFVCGCDHGLMPPPVLTGEVQFIGQMPENVVYCYVVVAIDRPPGDALDPTYLANYAEIPLPLPPDTTVNFRIPLSPGTYNWVFVAAIGNVDSLGMWNVVGQYTEEGDTIPKPITLDWNDSLWIRIVADLRGVHIP